MTSTEENPKPSTSSWKFKAFECLKHYLRISSQAFKFETQLTNVIGSGGNDTPHNVAKEWWTALFPKVHTLDIPSVFLSTNTSEPAQSVNAISVDISFQNVKQRCRGFKPWMVPSSGILQASSRRPFPRRIQISASSAQFCTRENSSGRKACESVFPKVLAQA